MHIYMQSIKINKSNLIENVTKKSIKNKEYLCIHTEAANNRCHCGKECGGY